jgi:hypothetical protein
MKILINAVLMASLFYFWQFENVDGAGNALLVLGYLRVIFSFTLFWVPTKEGPWYRMVGLWYSVALAVAFSWVGHVVLAVFLVLGGLLVYAARTDQSTWK